MSRKLVRAQKLFRADGLVSINAIAKIDLTVQRRIIAHLTIRRSFRLLFNLLSVGNNLLSIQKLG